MTYTRLNPADSGWQTLPLASGWVAYNSAQVPRYRKCGNVVQVTGAVKPTATTTVGSDFVVIGTLPSDCVPANRVLTINPASARNHVAIDVGTTGNVGAGRYGTDTAYVDVTTSHWLPINIIFLV